MTNRKATKARIKPEGEARDEPKLTSKQEKFAQLYIELDDAAEAWRQAYDADRMKADTVVRKANEALKNLKIAARIKALRAGHADRHKMTVDRLTEELLPIAFADAGDFFQWGPHGIKVKECSTLTRAQRSAVSEVRQTVTQHGGTIIVKLHNKLDAIEKLARLHGLIVDKKEISGEINLALSSRLEAARKRLQLEAKRPARPASNVINLSAAKLIETPKLARPKMQRRAEAVDADIIEAVIEAAS